MSDDTAAGSATEPDILIGISFGDAFRAQEFLTAMTRLASTGGIELHDAVVVAKDETGRTRVRETIDPQPGRSALSGAVWTGLLGLIVGGPVGWLAGLGVGAGAGAITAKAVDLGVPDEWVDWFREAVQPHTSTVVILARHVDQRALVAEAQRFTGAHLVYTNLRPDAIRRIEEALGQSPSDTVTSDHATSDPGGVDSGAQGSDLPPPSPPAG